MNFACVGVSFLRWVLYRPQGRNADTAPKKRKRSNTMTKGEIFERIVLYSAQACEVTPEEVLQGSRKADVVTARSIAVFWALAAGFSVDSLLACTERRNHNSIDSIRERIERKWTEEWAYHMLVVEAGKRLHEYAAGIGEDFDRWKPIAHIQKTTGRRFYNA